MRGIAAVGTLFLAAAALAGEAKRRTPKVTVAPVPTVVLARGGAAEAVVSVTVAEGLHVQANPAADEFLIPLVVRFGDVPGIRWGTPAYPPPVPFRIEGWDLELKTYERTVHVTVPVAAADAAEPGAVTVAGTVRFQACDSRRCFAPATVPVEVEVVVGE